MRLLVGIVVLISLILGFVAIVLCVRTNDLLEEFKQEFVFMKKDVNFLMWKFTILECNNRILGDNTMEIQSRIARFDRILNLGID